jgi:hypothetical protein
MTESVREEAGVRPAVRQPIVAWTLLAILIAGVITSAIAILAGDELTTPEDYRTHGSTYVDMFELVFILALCAIVSVIVWAAFHFLLFRRRAKLWKSLIALAAMILMVTVIGVFARVGTFLQYWEQDERALAEVRTNLNQRLHDLRSATEQTGHALRADRGLPRFRNEADVEAALVAIRKQRDDLSAFEAAAEEELQRARGEMLALDVFEGRRVDYIAQIDQILSPDSATHRLLSLERALLDKQEEAVRFLLDHRSSWDPDGESLAFNNRGDLNRMNEIMREAYEIIPQIDNLEGAGGQGVPRAVPEGVTQN